MAEAVGFIGLGNMGAPIATNLLHAGYSVRVYNRTQSRTAPLVREGAVAVPNPADVAQQGGIVFTMLANDLAVEEVCRAGASFVEKLGSGGIHVSMSTISPATTRRLAKHHEQFGVAYLASPVFGRPEAATAAKLFISLAGPAAAKKRVQPILTSVGQGVFDFGDDPGAANVVKLCGNFLLASTLEGLAETLTLAEKNGVNKEDVVEVIGKISPSHYGYAKLMAEGHFEPAGFRLALGLKDINLVLETATTSRTPLPLASLLHDRWLASVAKGREDLDWSAIALDVEENAGIAKR